MTVSRICDITNIFFPFVDKFRRRIDYLTGFTPNVHFIWILRASTACNIRLVPFYFISNAFLYAISTLAIYVEPLFLYGKLIFDLEVLLRLKHFKGDATSKLNFPSIKFVAWVVVDINRKHEGLFLWRKNSLKFQYSQVRRINMEIFTLLRSSKSQETFSNSRWSS